MRQRQFLLSPQEVRRIGKKAPQCTEVKSDLPHVLSFLLSTQPDPARIEVYCDSATVSTLRIFNGCIRHILERDCSVKRVEEIFRNPPKLSLVELDKELNLNQELKVSHSRSSKSSPEVVGQQKRARSGLSQAFSFNRHGNVISPEVLENDLTMLDIGEAVLMSESNILKSHYAAAIAAKQKKSTKLKLSLGAGGKDRPTREFACSFPAYVMEQVELALDDASSSSQLMTCAATNGQSALFIFQNGTYTTTEGVPKSLLEQMKKKKSAPKYVSLGTKGRYFVTFKNGKKCWEGPKSMESYLMKRNVKCIAFGKSMEDFFCVYQDGSWKSHGTMPGGLEKLMADRNHLGDLTCVTLGSNGEYFVKAKNGRMWWGGVTDEIDQVFDEMVSEVNKTLQFVDFGDEAGSYFMIYN